MTVTSSITTSGWGIAGFIRSTRERSTGSLALKLTIPHIPHINFSFVLAAFDHHTVFPEVSHDVWNGLPAFKNGFTCATKTVRIYRKQLFESSVLQAHPEKLT